MQDSESISRIIWEIYKKVWYFAAQESEKLFIYYAKLSGYWFFRISVITVPIDTMLIDILLIDTMPIDIMLIDTKLIDTMLIDTTLINTMPIHAA